MKRISIALCLLIALVSADMQAQRQGDGRSPLQNGLRIQSDYELVDIYVDGVLIGTSTNVCFVVNLPRGTYCVEAFLPGRGSNRSVYDQDIRYDGRGVFDVVIARRNDHRPERHPEPAPAPEVRRPMEMNPVEFQAFLGQLQKEKFDDSRLDFVKVAAPNKLFSCQQVRQIAATFTYDDNRLDAVKFLYPFTIDFDNYYLLRDVFTYGGNKSEFEKFLKNQQRR